MTDGHEQPVIVDAAGAVLHGRLAVPPGAVGIVVFVHGSGSDRFSPRNQRVAEALRREGLGTLLFDLLTAREEAEDWRTGRAKPEGRSQQEASSPREARSGDQAPARGGAIAGHALRSDVDFLASRVEHAVDWLGARPETAGLPLGLFGASVGAAAALVAAARRPERIRAVVSRGGSPELAGPALERVVAPTLLLVGGADHELRGPNRDALRRLRAEATLRVVPRAGRLFEEPGALELVAAWAGSWFRTHLAAEQQPSAP